MVYLEKLTRLKSIDGFGRLMGQMATLLVLPGVSLWLNWLMVSDIKWELAPNIMGWAVSEGEMFSMFLVLSLLYHFSTRCLKPQRQNVEDHTLITAQENNDADNLNRHRPRTWTVPGDKLKYRDNTPPTSIYICSLLVHFIPLLTPSPVLSPTIFLCSFPHRTLLLSIPQCVCVVCVWGALSACWLPGYQSNWGASGESLLSEPEPCVLLTPFILPLICSISLF